MASERAPPPPQRLCARMTTEFVLVILLQNAFFAFVQQATARHIENLPLIDATRFFSNKYMCGKWIRTQLIWFSSLAI
jgi:hypothetical protein